MALGIIKVKLLLFKVFKSMGNQGKRALYVRTFFCKFDTSYTLMKWIIYSLNWWKNDCKTSADTEKAFLGKNDYNGYECKSERSFANLTVLSVRFLLFFSVRCVLARLGILLVGKSGSVFAEHVCFLISSRHKKFASYNFWTKLLKAILWSLQTKKLFWNSLAHLPPMQNT